MANVDLDVEQEVRLPVDGATLIGDLDLPSTASAVVPFAQRAATTSAAPERISGTVTVPPWSVVGPDTIALRPST